MTEEKKNEEKDNCPLSCDGWIMFLSGEIDREENTKNQVSTTPTTTLLVVVALSIIALIFAVKTTNLPVNSTNSILSALLFSLLITIIVIFLYLIYLVYQFLRLLLGRGKIKALEEFREKIISGGLTNSNKICEEWEEIDRRLHPKKKNKT